MTSNMFLIRIRYAPTPKGLRHGQRGGPTQPVPSGLPTRRQGRALEPSCGHDLPTGESPPARAAENGHRPGGRRGRSGHATFRPLATAAASRTIARPDLPAPSGPILPDALTRVLTSRARRRPTSGQARKWVISTHGGKRTMPRHAHARRGQETERRTDAPPFLIFFVTVRLKPHDRNRLHIRATRYRTGVRRARGCSGG